MKFQQYDVCQRYGLSWVHISKLIQEGAFPAPDDAEGWSSQTLEEYDKRSAEGLRSLVAGVAKQATDCEHCSKRFYPTRSDARYCSSSCRAYACMQRKGAICA